MSNSPVASPSDSAASTSGVRWITVFGSARPKPDDPAYLQAYELGRAIGEAGFGVCNGGYRGTMSAGTAGARSVGAPARGITLEIFGPGDPELTEEIAAPSLFERIQMLVECADAVVILPGGTGTLLELSAVLELSNKSLGGKPRPIIFLGDFWRPTIDNVMDELKRNQEEPLAGRPRSGVLENLHFCSDVADVADFLPKRPAPERQVV